MMNRSIPKSPSHTLLAFCFWCIRLLCLVERCKAKDAANATTDLDEVRPLNAIFQQWGLSATDEWNISGDPCSGTAVSSSTISNPGIKCDCKSNGGGTCHIIEMKVYYQEVQGAIPEELSNLTMLTKLDVAYNKIEGFLPSFIGNFKHLRYLDVGSNSFHGSLPPEMGNLTSLQHLDTWSAGFKGLLSPELGNLSSLQYLDISSNGFNGLLPPELGNLSSLQYLDISSNGFNGLLPPELGNLSSLQMMDINFNGFNGLLPPELGNLSSLQKLYISSSGLGGEIPSTFANLRNMKILEAFDSQLTKIPNFIGNWTLTELYVSNNSITGPLPAFIGNITSMLYFFVSMNALSGSIPRELGNLQNLISLNIGSNNFTGSLPPELGNLTSLQKLDISSNNFNDSLPPELGNLTSLQELNIDSCGLSGEIPSTFANLRNVDILWASDNNFTGNIPDFIGSWPLTDLSMQGNAFEGPIPSSFSNLISLKYLRISDVSNGSSSLNFIENITSLRILDLSFNNLSGPIPASLFSISSLANLFLGNNSLSGTLPSQKSNTLLNIDLSYNNLSGSFPSWVSEEALNLNLVANNFIFNDFNRSGLALSLNCLQRSFPCHQKSPIQSSFAIRCGGPSMTINDTEYEGDYEQLGPSTYKVASTEKWAVSNVGIFAARSNGDDMFSGSNSKYNRHTEGVFPSTTDSELFQYARVSPGSLRYYGLGLENGNYTVNLKFAETEFPDSKTWESVGKRAFDIYLQGNLAWKDFDIKKEAGIAFKGIEKKRWVMVYEHILEIHLLWAGKGTCCIPSEGTYGPAISAIHVTPNFEPTIRTRRKKNKTALAVEILASIFLSIVSVSVFFIWRRKKKLSVDKAEEFLGMVPKPNTFSYGELKTATKDFSPANKLGQGGFGPVFKGTLLDGQIVAVKQLSVASHQGKSQLLAEIATISAVQHRNLVKLHGCCIKGANQLLVYEYLENKSLDQALFRNSNLHLDWHTRFKICLGTARGLAYLHEESRPRIVHRDIKASNILLDADLNPKISDFGLAKLYDDEMTHMSTRVAGTIGYLAPEYAMCGHLTEKADVFGFGVLTLEIVTGRPNTCQNVDLEKMYLLEWAWHLHENNRALELVDPKLSNFDEGEVARMISIALQCIQALPSLRPPMSRVVNMLLGDIEVDPISLKPGYLTGLPSNDTINFMSDDILRASASVTFTSQQFSSWYESCSSLDAAKPMLNEDIRNGR